MAFWSNWFKPACESCGRKILEGAPIEHDRKKICPSCHAEALAAEAAKQAELEARRAAEEEARARLAEVRGWRD